MCDHPFNVRPLGNLLSGAVARQSHRTLGIFTSLPHPLLVRILDALATVASPISAASALCAFGAASTATRAFAADEDLWRRLTFRQFGARAITAFENSWRYTFLSLVGAQPAAEPARGAFVYSDVLFHKWRCLRGTVDLQWMAVDTAARISVRESSPAAFRAEFEQRGLPVVITDAVTAWPAFSSWTREALIKRFGDVEFNAGGFDVSLASYFEYCDAVEGHDDQPLYIFDKHFAEKSPGLVADYTVPEYFKEDLFKVLGENCRPDYRWLIVGPARSGSSFHKDPNATSAWNAVVSGTKKWVLFPPDCPPPGVHPSGDEVDVTAPVSITEWFLNFYDSEIVRECGGVECVVRAGEMIFVPMGWWHCVLNVETSVAITQNYVSSVNVSSVAAWLRERPGQVSGCRSKEQAWYISANFPRLVVEQVPHLKEKLAKYLEPCERLLPLTKKQKRCLWDSLQPCAPQNKVPDGNTHLPCGAETPEQKTASFSFGF